MNSGYAVGAHRAPLQQRFLTRKILKKNLDFIRWFYFTPGNSWTAVGSTGRHVYGDFDDRIGQPAAGGSQFGFRPGKLHPVTPATKRHEERAAFKTVGDNVRSHKGYERSEQDPHQH